MSHDRFGTLFSFTTWGESHGEAIGVVIDGCPSGLALDTACIDAALARRAAGRNPYTTPRREQDTARIVSGVFGGVTTGAPISIIIDNVNVDSGKYAPMQHLLRPGHATHTYLQKYGVFDYRGGGRASARETACRVAAGAVAQRLLDLHGIRVMGWLESVGTVDAPRPDSIDAALPLLRRSPLFTADQAAEQAMGQAILDAVAAGDSLGGVVGFMAEGVPIGLGEPVYGKIDALLAGAMLGIPAAKGFEMGIGFAAAHMQGSAHHDRFVSVEGHIRTRTNHAGGCLGGITSGMPLWGRVAFKPTPSIRQPMQTVDIHGQPAVLHLPEGSRHDPCVAVRAVPVVEAMTRLVLADALLQHRARCHGTSAHGGLPPHLGGASCL